MEPRPGRGKRLALEAPVCRNCAAWRRWRHGAKALVLRMVSGRGGKIAAQGAGGAVKDAVQETPDDLGPGGVIVDGTTLVHQP